MAAAVPIFQFQFLQMFGVPLKSLPYQRERFT